MHRNYSPSLPWKSGAVAVASGDTTPCRMTGVASLSHVRYKESRGPQHVRAYLAGRPSSLHPALRFWASRLHSTRNLKFTDFIQTSISGRYDFPTKITSHVKLAVTSQRNCLVIFVANRIGDPRNRVSQKHSSRLNFAGHCRHRRPDCHFTVLHAVFRVSGVVTTRISSWTFLKINPEFCTKNRRNPS